jgi:hypothetical protein
LRDIDYSNNQRKNQIMKKLIAPLLISTIAYSFIISSCSKGGGGGGGTTTTTLTLSLSKSSVRADNFDETNITVRDQSGTDVTSSCMFNINNTTYATNIFHTTSIGDIPVYATKSGAKSNTVTLTATNPGPSPFTQKVYAEDYTGSWCGYCPRVGLSLGNYTAGHPNCIVVGVHSPTGSSDPYIYQYASSLVSAFNITGWPTAVINRNYNWNESTSVLDQEATKRAPLGVSLVSTVSGSTINVTAKVKFDVTTTVGMKLVLMLVEDGLVYPQTNYYPSYGANPLPGYVHNHVLRTAATDIFGELLPSAQQTIGNTWQKNYSFNAAAYNISNCKIIGLVIFDNNGGGYKGSLNVQEVAAGQTKNFD